MGRILTIVLAIFTAISFYSQVFASTPSYNSSSSSIELDKVKKDIENVYIGFKAIENNNVQLSKKFDDLTKESKAIIDINAKPLKLIEDMSINFSEPNATLGHNINVLAIFVGSFISIISIILAFFFWNFERKRNELDNRYLQLFERETILLKETSSTFMEEVKKEISDGDFEKTLHEKIDKKFQLEIERIDGLNKRYHNIMLARAESSTSQITARQNKSEIVKLSQFRLIYKYVATHMESNEYGKALSIFNKYHNFQLAISQLLHYQFPIIADGFNILLAIENKYLPQELWDLVLLLYHQKRFGDEIIMSLVTKLGQYMDRSLDEAKF